MKHIVYGCLLLTILVSSANAQQTLRVTGTALTYGTGFNTRAITRTFDLRLTGETSDADTANYITVLRENGQDALLDAINDNDLGNATFGGRIGPQINAVRINDVDGKRRIRVLFERWMNFDEMRGGYRSTDYPFGYMEIIYDPRTGKGDGTYISAARIRFRDSRNEVEIEEFGSFPGRLLGVRVSGGPTR